MKSILVFVVAGMLALSASAKLPAPSDDARAKAAEAAAKTAHGGKVEAYLLCKSQDKVAARYGKNKPAKPTGKDAKAAAAASTCTDPGPFVYTPPPPPVAPAAPAAKP